MSSTTTITNSAIMAESRRPTPVTPLGFIFLTVIPLLLSMDRHQRPPHPPDDLILPAIIPPAVAIVHSVTPHIPILNPDLPFLAPDVPVLSLALQPSTTLALIPTPSYSSYDRWPLISPPVQLALAMLAGGFIMYSGAGYIHTKRGHTFTPSTPPRRPVDRRPRDNTPEESSDEEGAGEEEEEEREREDPSPDPSGDPEDPPPGNGPLDRKADRPDVKASWVVMVIVALIYLGLTIAVVDRCYPEHTQHMWRLVSLAEAWLTHHFNNTLTQANLREVAEKVFTALIDEHGPAVKAIREISAERIIAEVTDVILPLKALVPVNHPEVMNPVSHPIPITAPITPTVAVPPVVVTHADVDTEVFIAPTDIVTQISSIDTACPVITADIIKPVIPVAIVPIVTVLEVPPVPIPVLDARVEKLEQLIKWQQSAGLFMGWVLLAGIVHRALTWVGLLGVEEPVKSEGWAIGSFETEDVAINPMEDVEGEQKVEEEQEEEEEEGEKEDEHEEPTAMSVGQGTTVVAREVGVMEDEAEKVEEVDFFSAVEEVPAVVSELRVTVLGSKPFEASQPETAYFDTSETSVRFTDEVSPPAMSLACGSFTRIDQMVLDLGNAPQSSPVRRTLREEDSSVALDLDSREDEPPTRNYSLIAPVETRDFSTMSLTAVLPSTIIVPHFPPPPAPIKDLHESFTPSAICHLSGLGRQLDGIGRIADEIGATTKRITAALDSPMDEGIDLSALYASFERRFNDGQVSEVSSGHSMLSSDDSVLGDGSILDHVPPETGMSSIDSANSDLAPTSSFDTSMPSFLDVFTSSINNDYPPSPINTTSDSSGTWSEVKRLFQRVEAVIGESEATIHRADAIISGTENFDQSCTLSALGRRFDDMGRRADEVGETALRITNTLDAYENDRLDLSAMHASLQRRFEKFERLLDNPDLSTSTVASSSVSGRSMSNQGESSLDAIWAENMHPMDEALRTEVSQLIPVFMEGMSVRIRRMREEVAELAGDGEKGSWTGGGEVDHYPWRAVDATRWAPEMEDEEDEDEDEEEEEVEHVEESEEGAAEEVEQMKQNEEHMEEDGAQGLTEAANEEGEYLLGLGQEVDEHDSILLSTHYPELSDIPEEEEEAESDPYDVSAEDADEQEDNNEQHGADEAGADEQEEEEWRNAIQEEEDMVEEEEKEEEEEDKDNMTRKEVELDKFEEEHQELEVEEGELDPAAAEKDETLPQDEDLPLTEQAPCVSTTDIESLLDHAAQYTLTSSFGSLELGQGDRVDREDNDEVEAVLFDASVEDLMEPVVEVGVDAEDAEEGELEAAAAEKDETLPQEDLPPTKQARCVSTTDIESLLEHAAQYTLTSSFGSLELGEGDRVDREDDEEVEAVLFDASVEDLVKPAVGVGVDAEEVMVKEVDDKVDEAGVSAEEPVGAETEERGKMAEVPNVENMPITIPAEDIPTREPLVQNVHTIGPDQPYAPTTRPTTPDHADLEENDDPDNPDSAAARRRRGVLAIPGFVPTSPMLAGALGQLKEVSGVVAPPPPRFTLPSTTLRRVDFSEPKPASPSINAVDFRSVLKSRRGDSGQASTSAPKFGGGKENATPISVVPLRRASVMPSSSRLAEDSALSSNVMAWRAAIADTTPTTTPTPAFKALLPSHLRRQSTPTTTPKNFGDQPYVPTFNNFWSPKPRPSKS